MVQIADIERSILAWLVTAADTGVLPYRWGRAASWPASWDEELAKAGGYPAVWATFGGWAQPERAHSGPKVKARFAVAVAGKNKRSAAAAAQGGPVAGETGALTLMDDVIHLLSGVDFGLDIGGLELGPVTTVPASDAMKASGVSLIVVEFVSTFILDRPAPFRPSAEFDGVFARLVAEWTMAGEAPDTQPDFFTHQEITS